MRHVVAALLLWTVGLLPAGAADRVSEDNSWRAGFARVVITPDEPMWMSGYGNRDHAAEGKVHDLYARAAALRDPFGATAVFVATDLVGVPPGMAAEVARHLEEQHNLPRSALMLTSSHTHCGPALDDLLSHMLAMNEQDWAQVRAYQKQLNRKLIEAVDAALNDLQPALLSTGSGVARFAANRRAPRGLGPYDHQVPVLKATSPNGEIRGIIFGYACHNTTVGFYQWCGDYAGFAALDLEDRHPGATALFFAGCGADQNPLPRRTLELAQKYGRLLSVAVEWTLSDPMKPVSGRLRTGFRTIDLPFASIPTEQQLHDALKHPSRFERARAGVLLEQLRTRGKIAEAYPYPVQVWQLGDGITWIALGGEVVVEYALRLKQELGEDRTWVTGYANDVMAYIPSERVLAEGGYEGASSMIPYQQPSPWKPGLEARIITTAVELSQELRAGKDSN